MKQYKARKIFKNKTLIDTLFPNTLTNLIDWLHVELGAEPNLAELDYDSEGVVDYQSGPDEYRFEPCTKTEIDWLLATTLKNQALKDVI